MMSVAANAGEAMPNAEIAAASCIALNGDFTVKTVLNLCAWRS
jgi:hypothetical protein